MNQETGWYTDYSCEDKLSNNEMQPCSARTDQRTSQTQPSMSGAQQAKARTGPSSVESRRYSIESTQQRQQYNTQKATLSLTSSGETQPSASAYMDYSQPYGTGYGSGTEEVLWYPPVEAQLNPSKYSHESQADNSKVPAPVTGFLQHPYLIAPFSSSFPYPPPPRELHPNSVARISPYFCKTQQSNSGYTSENQHHTSEIIQQSNSECGSQLSESKMQMFIPAYTYPVQQFFYSYPSLESPTSATQLYMFQPQPAANKHQYRARKQLHSIHSTSGIQQSKSRNKLHSLQSQPSNSDSDTSAFELKSSASEPKRVISETKACISQSEAFSSEANQSASEASHSGAGSDDVVIVGSSPVMPRPIAPDNDVIYLSDRMAKLDPVTLKPLKYKGKSGTQLSDDDVIFIGSLDVNHTETPNPPISTSETQQAPTVPKTCTSITQSSATELQSLEPQTSNSNIEQLFPPEPSALEMEQAKTRTQSSTFEAEHISGLELESDVLEFNLSTSGTDCTEPRAQSYNFITEILPSTVVTESPGSEPQPVIKSEMCSEEDVKPFVDCIDLCDEIENPEEVFNRFHYDSLKHIMRQIWCTQNEENFIKLLEQLKFFLEDRCDEVTLKEDLVMLLQRYLLVLCDHFGRICRYLTDRYLDLMVDILVNYAESIRHLTNSYPASEQEKFASHASRQARYLVTRCLFYRMDSIFHFLLKGYFHMGEEGNYVFWIQFLQVMTNNIQFTITEQDAYRIFITWHKFNVLTREQNFGEKGIDTLLFTKFRESLILNMANVSYTQKVLIHLQQDPGYSFRDIIMTYFKWWNAERTVGINADRYAPSVMVFLGEQRRKLFSRILTPRIHWMNKTQIFMSDRKSNRILPIFGASILFNSEAAELEDPEVLEILNSDARLLKTRTSNLFISTSQPEGRPIGSFPIRPAWMENSEVLNTLGLKPRTVDTIDIDSDSSDQSLNKEEIWTLSDLIFMRSFRSAGPSSSDQSYYEVDEVSRALMEYDMQGILLSSSQSDALVDAETQSVSEDSIQILDDLESLEDKYVGEEILSEDNQSAVQGTSKLACARKDIWNYPTYDGENSSDREAFCRQWFEVVGLGEDEDKIASQNAKKLKSNEAQRIEPNKAQNLEAQDVESNEDSPLHIPSNFFDFSQVVPSYYSPAPISKSPEEPSLGVMLRTRFNIELSTSNSPIAESFPFGEFDKNETNKEVDDYEAVLVYDRFMCQWEETLHAQSIEVSDALKEHQGDVQMDKDTRMSKEISNNPNNHGQDDVTRTDFVESVAIKINDLVRKEEIRNKSITGMPARSMNVEKTEEINDLEVLVEEIVQETEQKKENESTLEKIESVLTKENKSDKLRIQLEVKGTTEVIEIQKGDGQKLEISEVTLVSDALKIRNDKPKERQEKRRKSSTEAEGVTVIFDKYTQNQNEKLDVEENVEKNEKVSQIMIMAENLNQDNELGQLKESGNPGSQVDNKVEETSKESEIRECNAGAFEVAKDKPKERREKRSRKRSKIEEEPVVMAGNQDDLLSVDTCKKLSDEESIAEQEQENKSMLENTNSEFDTLKESQTDKPADREDTAVFENTIKISENREDYGETPQVSEVTLASDELQKICKKLEKRRERRRKINISRETVNDTTSLRHQASKIVEEESVNLEERGKGSHIEDEITEDLPENIELSQQNKIILDKPDVESDIPKESKNDKLKSPDNKDWVGNITKEGIKQEDHSETSKVPKVKLVFSTIKKVYETSGEHREKRRKRNKVGELSTGNSLVSGRSMKPHKSGVGKNKAKPGKCKKVSPVEETLANDWAKDIESHHVEELIKGKADIKSNMLGKNQDDEILVEKTTKEDVDEASKVSKIILVSSTSKKNYDKQEARREKRSKRTKIGGTTTGQITEMSGRFSKSLGKSNVEESGAKPEKRRKVSHDHTIAKDLVQDTEPDCVGIFTIDNSDIDFDPPQENHDDKIVVDEIKKLTGTRGVVDEAFETLNNTLVSGSPKSKGRREKRRRKSKSKDVTTVIPMRSTKSEDDQPDVEKSDMKSEKRRKVSREETNVQDIKSDYTDKIDAELDKFKEGQNNKIVVEKTAEVSDKREGVDEAAKVLKVTLLFGTSKKYSAKPGENRDKRRKRNRIEDTNIEKSTVTVPDISTKKQDDNSIVEKRVVKPGKRRKMSNAEITKPEEFQIGKTPKAPNKQGSKKKETMANKTSITSKKSSEYQDDKPVSEKTAEEFDKFKETLDIAVSSKRKEILDDCTDTKDDNTRGNAVSIVLEKRLETTSYVADVEETIVTHTLDTQNMEQGFSEEVEFFESMEDMDSSCENLVITENENDYLEENVQMPVESYVSRKSLSVSNEELKMDATSYQEVSANNSQVEVMVKMDVQPNDPAHMANPCHASAQENENEQVEKSSSSFVGSLQSCDQDVKVTNQDSQQKEDMGDTDHGRSTMIEEKLETVNKPTSTELEVGQTDFTKTESWWPKTSGQGVLPSKNLPDAEEFQNDSEIYNASNSRKSSYSDESSSLTFETLDKNEVQQYFDESRKLGLSVSTSSEIDGSSYTCSTTTTSETTSTSTSTSGITPQSSPEKLLDISEFRLSGQTDMSKQSAQICNASAVNLFTQEWAKPPKEASVTCQDNFAQECSSAEIAIQTYIEQRRSKSADKYGAGSEPKQPGTYTSSVQENILQAHTLADVYTNFAKEVSVDSNKDNVNVLDSSEMNLMSPDQSTLQPQKEDMLSESGAVSLSASLLLTPNYELEQQQFISNPTSCKATVPQIRFHEDDKPQHSGSQPYSPQTSPSTRMCNVINAQVEDNTMLYSNPTTVPQFTSSDIVQKQDIPNRAPSTRNKITDLLPKISNVLRVTSPQNVKATPAAIAKNHSVTFFEEKTREIYTKEYGNRSESKEAQDPPTKGRRRAQKMPLSRGAIEAGRSVEQSLKTKKRERPKKVHITAEDNDLFQNALEGPTGKPLRNADGTAPNMLWDDIDEPLKTRTVSVKAKSQLYPSKNENLVCILKRPRPKGEFELTTRNEVKDYKVPSTLDSSFFNAYIKIKRNDIISDSLMQRYTKDRLRQQEAEAEEIKRQRAVKAAHDRALQRARMMELKEQQVKQETGILYCIFTDKWNKKAKNIFPNYGSPNSNNRKVRFKGETEDDYNHRNHSYGQRVSEKRRRNDLSDEVPPKKSKISVRTDLIDKKPKSSLPQVSATTSYGEANTYVRKRVKINPVPTTNVIDSMESSTTSLTRRSRLKKTPNRKYYDITENRSGHDKKRFNF